MKFFLWDLTSSVPTPSVHVCMAEDWTSGFVHARQVRPIALLPRVERTLEKTFEELFSEFETLMILNINSLIETFMVNFTPVL